MKKEFWQVIALFIIELMLLLPVSFALSINNVEVTRIEDTSAIISWVTDKNATSAVYYGLNNALDQVKEDSRLGTNHSLSITGLSKGGKYSYKTGSCYGNDSCVNSSKGEFETGVDIVPPTIDAAIPEFHNKNKMDIEGSVEPNSIVKLYVNDMLAAARVLDRQETSDGKFTFRNVALRQSNTIKIWAQDQAQNANEATYKVVVDTQEPVVTLEDIPSATKNITIKGTVDEQVMMNVYLKSGEEKVPGKSTGLQAVASNNSVDLSWNKSEENEFSHYVVYRDDVGAIAKTKPASYNSYKDVLVNNGESYIYQVSAINEFGKEGAKSDSVTVSISGGQTGLPKPDLITDIAGGSRKLELSQNVSGSFSTSITLQKDGIYTLQIEFVDKALNTVLIEKSINFDTKPPEINIIKPKKGAFIYENYANEVDIEGETEPFASVHMYIERTPLGYLNKSFDISGLPNEIQNIPESKLKEDCRLNIAGTSFCSTGADYSTVADSNGKFKFEKVDMTSWLGIGSSISEIPATELSSDRQLQEQTKTRVVFIATDSSGLRGAESFEYRIGTCWSGNFSWEVTPLLDHQSPSLLSMERLRENTEQIFFYFNYSYAGRGEDGRIVQGGVSVSKACDGTELLKDRRFNLSCKVLPASGSTVVNPEGTTSYTIVKLSSLENMDKWLEHDWKSFFKAVSNEFTFPFKVRITYEHEVEGITVTETQTTCQEVTYVLDNSMVDFKNVLPDWVLYDLVDFLNSSVSIINDIQKEMRKIIEYTAIACVASFLLRLGWQVYRRWISIFDEKKFAAEKLLDIGFEPEEDGDKEYCQKVAGSIARQLKGLSKDQELVIKNFGIVKLKYFSDADLKKCFPATAAAWKTEANLYRLYRYSCDRIFGHKSPSRWTEQATDDELYSKLKKGTGCAVDESVMGQPLMVNKCRDVAKDFGYAKDHFNIDNKCFVFKEGNDETLYTLSNTESTQYDIYTIKYSKGPGKSSSDYAIKQTDNRYLTAQNENCDEVCGVTKKTEPTEKKKRWNKGKPEEKVEEDPTTYFDCIPVSECRALKGQPEIEGRPAADGRPEIEGRPEVKEVFTRGFTKDCFYKAEPDWAPELKSRLNQPESVSNDPSQRYECCCINAVKAPPSEYYRYDDMVKYVVEKKERQYAFESKTKEGSEPQGSGEGERWADMKWSYRYWKEKYQSVSNSITESGQGRDHYEYNENRYIEGRDFPACFGQNSWIYDSGKIFGVDTEPGKGNLLIMDPAKQWLSTFQCLHITGISNRLQILKNIMSALSMCLITVRTTGRGDTGVCKELFTQYVCSLIWQIIQYWKEGCLPFGKGIDISKSESKLVEYVSAGVKSVWGSVEDSRNELADEYGNAKLNNLIGAGEEQIARKICLAAFGYDWEITLDNVIDVAYASPYSTLVQKMTSTREFLTISPTGKASYEYRASWLINPGCDMQNYKVELSCISRNEMDEHEGINCEKVEDPAGNDCDCLGLDEEKRHSFYSSSSKLLQGTLVDMNWKQIVDDSFYRYDHLKFTLRIDQKIKSDLRESCFPEGNLYGGKGVFYAPIRDKTVVDMASCRLDPSQGQFTCTPAADFWTSEGRAYFTKIMVNGYDYSREEEFILSKGESLEVEPIITKLQGPPVCLIVKVSRGSVKDRKYLLVDIDGQHNYRIPIEDHVAPTAKSSPSSSITGCKPDEMPDSDKTCIQVLSGRRVKLKALSITNTQQKEVTLKFKDTWSLNGPKNHEIDLLKNSEDMMSVNGVEKAISKWWKEKYGERGVIIELENDGIVLKVEDVGYAEGIDSVEYDVKVDPVGTEEQIWTIELGLYQPKDEDEIVDCSRYRDSKQSEELARYAGRRQKETVRVKVLGKESESVYKPKITIDAEDVTPVEKNLPHIIRVKVSDDKGIDEVKYKIKKPNAEILEDSVRKKIKRMKCGESSTSAYVTENCDISLDAKDLDIAGDYTITVTAKDKDPDGKQKVNIVDEPPSDKPPRTFKVRCYTGNEWGVCQKEGECSTDNVKKDPILGCVEEYECCKDGTR